MAKTGRPSCRDAVLEALPGTISQVARRSEVSQSSAGKWLAILNEESTVYISRWVRRKNGPVPFYRLRVKESSVDSPKPQALTNAEYQRRYEEKHPGRRAEIKAAYEERRKKARQQRKMKLASWAAPLTVAISKSY